MRILVCASAILALCGCKGFLDGLADDDEEDDEPSAYSTYECGRMEKAYKDFRKGRIDADEYMRRNREVRSGKAESSEWDRLRKDLERGRISKTEYVERAQGLHRKECGD